MKVAVITSYHEESAAALRRTVESVRAQTHACTHFVIAAGPPRAEVESWGVQHVKLSAHHTGAGDAAHLIGTGLAHAQGFDAVCWLDTSSWFEPDHIASCVGLAMQRRVPLVTASRLLHRPDGTLLGACGESNGVTFCDANCYFIQRDLMRVAIAWSFARPEDDAISERRVWKQALKAANSSAHLPRPTVHCETLYALHYLARDEAPPPGAKTWSRRDDGLLELAPYADVARRPVQPGLPELLTYVGEGAAAAYARALTEQEQGNLRGAAEELGVTVELAPHCSLFRRALGNTLMAAGDLQNVELHLECAARLDPNSADAHFDLAWALCELRRPDRAIQHFKRGLQLNPNNALAHNRLGITLVVAGRPDDAVASFRRAIELDPLDSSAHGNLAGALRALGSSTRAAESYRRALELNPANIKAHSSLLLTLSSHPGYDDAKILEEARAWDERHAAPLTRRAVPHEPRPPGDRLRIGYISADFRGHVQARFMIPLLDHHDRSAFRIFCYSTVRVGDQVTELHKGCVDGFRDISRMSDAEAARMIREDQTDILVDVTLHAGGSRLLVAAHRPAPVQVAWLGYPGTTGVSAIDYRLTDPYTDPPALALPGSEESWRLPDTLWCYKLAGREVEPAPVPALSRGHVTFGCLNHFAKTNEHTFELWARALLGVEGSKLLMLAPVGRVRERTRAIFASKGISGDRVEFVDQASHTDYLSNYGRVDISLDTLPYNGHTTSIDSWWMGVPVLSLVGNTIAGRACVCFTQNLGLHEWAVDDADSFVRAAKKLSSDLPMLASLRRELRDKVERSPLHDFPRFARNIEAAYREMWRRYEERAGAKS